MAFLKNIRVQAALVFLIAVLQYANTANHDYAWDDAIVITENSRVKQGLKDIPELFKNKKSNETENHYGYRPIALLSFATDVQFFGMDPHAAHRVNIFLYGLLSVIVLVFLHRLFPEMVAGNFLVALLFVVHPIHSEVVANIKSRDEILALGFGLLGLMSYAKAISGGKWWHYLVSLLFMVLGFLSKESAVTLIGVAFILPWVLLDPQDHLGNLKKTLPLFIFLIFALVLRALVYSDLFFESNDFELQEKGLFLEDGYVGNPLFAASTSERLATAVYLAGYFVYRFVVPYPLVHDYSYSQFAVRSFGDPMVWLAAIVLLVAVVVSIRGVLKRKPYGIGLIIFLLTGSIYLHLVQIAPDIFAERFLFAPSLGLCVALLSLFTFEVTKKWSGVVILVVMIPLFGYGVYRNKAWKDNRTLLETDLPKLENCVRANYNYALLLHREYYSLPEPKRPEAAKKVLHYYERTLQLTDRLFNVYIDLGSAYMEFGYPNKGKAVFEAAIEEYPDLSMPYVQMGKYYMSFQEYAKAIPYFQHAIKNGSTNSDFYYLLSICLFNSGWYDDAIERLETGEKLGTSSASYFELMAKLYMKVGETGKALSAIDRGLAIYPGNAGLVALRRQIGS
ncbi:MAG: tetratricopeptide repeat protein [Flavobacteriales bacterium]|nr:tetratricopeptide repeat protein [Flavobacteriales bacterium]